MMDNNPTMKKTLGRRKIEVRSRAYTKRRMGKASELSVVCSYSPPRTSFSRSATRTSVESVLKRGRVFRPTQMLGEESRVKYAEAVKKLLWWEKNFQGMELHEYVDALEGLRDIYNVMKRASTSSNLTTYHAQDFNGGKSSLQVVKMEVGQAQTVEDDGANASASFSNFFLMKSNS